MLTFYGQPKFKSDETDLPPAGYELFIRERTATGWQLPKDFNAITVEQLKALLLKTIPLMPASVISIAFNLEPAQFIDHRYIDMIAEVQQTTSLMLSTELTERADEQVTIQQLVQAAKYFAELDLQICIDDVGSGRNTLGLVLQLNKYVSEYKFAC
ncbi:c-di-GMP phosphodiesterase [Loigolactobacillus zhaoyuanensis]|uniref:C-di-GMP phosphodiesterase n=1 Tax=Loigolactobacillus zhaoyuanensis TaxID=2486017 RepID=A0ABW8UDS6_9LACO